MQRVEFTIEPFTEGEPGPHVTAPTDAVRSIGVDVEVGPFGSSCDIDDTRVGEVVASLVQAAVDHGATHVSVHVERIDP